jgi:superfamily II DNA helicase RecQ
MGHKFFRIPTADPLEMEAVLNAFCSRHQVSHIDNHFVVDGGNSFWAIHITWSENTGPLTGNPGGPRKNKIDYKEVLSEKDFSIFSTLREVRKAIAEREGTPAYNIFTNEQLAAMVRQRLTSKAALLEVEGIGQARVEKYGDIFLQNLKELFALYPSDETDRHKS